MTDATESAAGSSIQYEYMFERDKSPTKQLDALLRAIALAIVSTLRAEAAEGRSLLGGPGLLTWTSPPESRHWRQDPAVFDARQARRLLQGRRRELRRYVGCKMPLAATLSSSPSL